MKKRKIINDSLKTAVTTVTVLIFLTITGFYLFNLYINIDIQNEGIITPYEASRTSQTVADIKEDKKNNRCTRRSIIKCCRNIKITGKWKLNIFTRRKHKA